MAGAIDARYVALLEGWHAKMELDSWVRGEMVDAESRVSQGEDPEAVMQDLHDRFEGRFGEDSDASSR